MLQPKKSLGQHFLHESGIRQRIIALLAPQPGEQILEIGPGEGALTAGLLASFGSLEAVEVDADAVAFLQERYPEGLQLHHTDVLSFVLSAERQYVVVGNLPYNISSPILFWLLEQRTQLRQAVLMVQEEVARRICSPPGERAGGILSVLVQAYFRAEYAFRVAPGAFRPPPNVQSAVFTLERKPQDEWPALPFQHLKTVVKTAFGQRRKTLRNALKPLGKTVPEAFARRRAESLSLKEFITLAEALQ